VFSVIVSRIEQQRSGQGIDLDILNTVLKRLVVA